MGDYLHVALSRRDNQLAELKDRLSVLGKTPLDVAVGPPLVEGRGRVVSAAQYGKQEGDPAPLGSAKRGFRITARM